MSDWKDNISYPYKGYTLTDPKYIKDRDEFFAGNNGWWWGRGWWSDEKYETPMELQRRYREEKENA